MRNIMQRSGRLFEADTDRMEYDQQQTPNETKYDKCVCCRAPTPYTVDTPISLRKYYIQGCGQLCKACFYDTQRCGTKEDSFENEEMTGHCRTNGKQ